MTAARVASDDELRGRLRAALRDAGKPLPVKDLAVQARLTDGAVVLFLRELAAAGEAIVVVEPGRPAPYLDLGGAR